MAPDSVVRFANGVYMGSDGAFEVVAPDGVPIIEATDFRIPVDPGKVKDVLNSVADEIKSPTDQAYKRSRAR